MSSHPLYQEWLGHVIDPDGSSTFVVSETEIATLIEMTSRNSGRDLIRFADMQVNQVVWTLSSPAGSDYSFCFRSDQVPLDILLSAIRSIVGL